MGEQRTKASSRSCTKCYNFLKDVFKSAFSNDHNLLVDKRKGQYDNIYTGEEAIDHDRPEF